MTEETQGAVPTDAEDTASVLAIASGEKTYLEPKAEAETPEPKAEAETEEDEDPGEDPAAPTEPEPGVKPKLTARERVQQAVARQREAERDRDFYREQALRGTQPAPTPAQEAQPNTPQGDGRPDPAKYDLGNYDPQFIEDLTDWKANSAAQRIAAEQATQRQVSDAQASFQTRTATLFPDGPSDGLNAFMRLQSLPVGVIEVIAASEIGPKLAEHLGDNPAELQRLSTLSPAGQARELTRLETRLTEPPPAPKPTPKTATDAPEPPPQARGSGGQFKVSPDTDDFAAFEKQYRVEG